MHQTVEAIYEDGVLRPLEKLSLRPKQRVFLQIDESPDAAGDIYPETVAGFGTSKIIP